MSVFKIIQELLAPSQKKGKNQFQQLMEMLPDDHKAKWFAGAALNTAEQSMASVMSTALSRLNSFLDSELEQLLCFDTEIDAEKFCNEKSAIFVVMPEENPNTFFMISLIIQQLYREILAVADEHGGKLKNRCVFFCDEFGTLPKIESAEMMFSASRSRRLQIVPIIQSFSQLDKNYGKEGAEIIVDNTQLTIFGGFAPNSSSAEVLSKALGSRTVMSGSVSRSRNDPSESLQMIERPLLTPDELKSLPKGHFVVMKTGVHPMRVKLKLFFKWGIEFDEDNPYAVADNGGREVQYAEKKEIMDGIVYTLRKALVKSYLGKTVTISIDRPIGSIHPKHDIIYPINYGFIPKVLGGDGEELDVYLLGVDAPVKEYTARIIGIVHRRNDVEDKLIAAPEGRNFTVEEIMEAVRFQEQYYDSEIEI